MASLARPLWGAYRVPTANPIPSALTSLGRPPPKEQRKDPRNNGLIATHSLRHLLVTLSFGIYPSSNVCP